MSEKAVILDAVRTPIGKSGWKGMEKGGRLSRMNPLDLSGLVVSEVVKRTKAPPGEIEDVIMGVLSQIGEQGGNFGRMTCFTADLPDEVCGTVVNRYCGSGLQACNFAAMSILSGCGDLVVAGGAESMSHYPMGSDVSAGAKHLKEMGISYSMPRKVMKKGLVMMGNAADMIAQRYGFTREQTDRYALQSQQRAVRAWREGRYESQIVPVPVPKKADGAPAQTPPPMGPTGALFGTSSTPPASGAAKTGEVEWFTQDEGIRPDCLDKPEESLAKMGKLPLRFDTKKGVHTAANSSQITDAAAAVMLASEKKAKEMGAKPKATVKSMAVIGSEPIIMLLGIAPSMKKALKRAGLTMDDMDVIEINEAFTSAVLAACKELGIEQTDPRLNPNGGAVAIGHPIGASGAILLTKAVHELQRTKKDHAIISLCMGGGMGIATVIERM
ncbi:MAG: thiolase family protein [Euryarchaeota archaeon]|nr:thiolase family protein [Euryarchaeota archaeon]